VNEFLKHQEEERKEERYEIWRGQRLDFYSHLSLQILQNCSLNNSSNQQSTRRGERNETTSSRRRRNDGYISQIDLGQALNILNNPLGDNELNQLLATSIGSFLLCDKII